MPSEIRVRVENSLRPPLAPAGPQLSNIVFNSDGSITDTGTPLGSVVTFNSDGSITTVYSGGSTLTVHTVFNSDGSITETAT